MKQASLPLDLKLKKTRNQVLLEQMEQVVPWADLIALIALYYPEGKNVRPPFPLMTMLRTHFMQQLFTLQAAVVIGQVTRQKLFNGCCAPLPLPISCSPP